MPRSEARIRTNTWRNQDFTTLTRAQQATYWLLLSQPDMNQAGVVPYVPQRWYACSADDPSAIDADLDALHRKHYVLVDGDSGEVWVRSFAKYDGVLRSPKTRSGMWSAYRAVLSSKIRTAFVAELDQEYLDEALTQEWITHSDLPEQTDADPWNPPPHTPPEGVSHTPYEPVNTPPDTPSDPLPDTPSDRGPSRARAASASSSASSSANSPEGEACASDDASLTLLDSVPDTRDPPNGKPKSSMQEWLVVRTARQVGEHREFQSLHGFYDAVLRQALDQDDLDPRGTSIGLICEFVHRANGEKPANGHRDRIASLVTTHQPETVLYAVAQSVDWGAGMTGEHANDPDAWVNYVTAVVQKREKVGA